MTGSTDINPELTRRVTHIEAEMERCFVTVQEMRLIVKQTLDQDGDLNVTQVRKDLEAMKQWVKDQSSSEKAFWEAFT